MQSLELSNALGCATPAGFLAADAAAQTVSPTQMQTIRSRRMIFKAFSTSPAPLYCRACALQQKATRHYRRNKDRNDDDMDVARGLRATPRREWRHRGAVRRR